MPAVEEEKVCRPALEDVDALKVDPDQREAVELRALLIRDEAGSLSRVEVETGYPEISLGKDVYKSGMRQIVRCSIKALRAQSL
jgi:hypothetical protein